ncbi:hypothetical protein FRC15_011647 [Serendipita sp. 397]|nr:hypothetical protein FRC15_011647 [Serendipita sp. 397]
MRLKSVDAPLYQENIQQAPIDGHNLLDTGILKRRKFEASDGRKPVFKGAKMSCQLAVMRHMPVMGGPWDASYMHRFTVVLRSGHQNPRQQQPWTPPLSQVYSPPTPPVLLDIGRPSQTPAEQIRDIQAPLP